MPERSFSGTTQYRYGFNGKENDNEVKGTGNEQDYGMRIYDPRIGKFLSPDPLSLESSESSPYCFADNSPVALVDVNGEKGEPGFTVKTDNGQINIKKPLLDNISISDLEKYVQERVNEIVPPRPPSVPLGERIIRCVKQLRNFTNAVNIAITVLSVETGEGPLYEKLGPFLYKEYSAAQAFLIGQKYNPTKNNFEILTSDPSQLPSWYLEDVKQRLLDGTASTNDQNYKNEIVRRGLLSNRFGEKQEYGKKADSKVLGKNLERAGEMRPGVSNTTAAHHIVEGTDERHKVARQILARENIDINDADNGVFLNIEYHNKLHTNNYRDKILERLKGAAPGHVREELNKIRDELKKGIF